VPLNFAYNTSSQTQTIIRYTQHSTKSDSDGEVKAKDKRHHRTPYKKKRNKKGQRDGKHESEDEGNLLARCRLFLHITPLHKHKTIIRYTQHSTKSDSDGEAKAKDKRHRRTLNKKNRQNSSSENEDPSDDEFVDPPHKPAARKRSVDPFNGNSQKLADLVTLEGLCRAATHDFVPHKPAKKQFMYWGGHPESAVLMLIER
jgi:hypothetical protein